MVNEYADLNNIIADQVRQEFCPEGSSSSFKLVGNQCEKNECLVNNGGCQENFLRLTWNFYSYEIYQSVNQSVNFARKSWEK